jgi:hypothetical protein
MGSTTSRTRLWSNSKRICFNLSYFPGAIKPIFSNEFKISNMSLASYVGCVYMCCNLNIQCQRHRRKLWTNMLNWPPTSAIILTIPSTGISIYGLKTDSSPFSHQRQEKMLMTYVHTADIDRWPCFSLPVLNNSVSK